MEQNQHKYVCVAYELFADNEKGIHELIEKAPAEHPFQFISDMGITLDSFEEKIMVLNEGDTFDFTLSVDEAYGPYEDEHVIELDKSIFCINGRFDKETIYPGNFVPLVNADGNRFQGLILEVKDQKVTVDLNHPLAGKDLHFRGNVVTMRDATPEEVEGMARMMNGEDDECGCGGCHGDGCGHGEGCGHGHEHGEDGHQCCGHGHGHGNGEGCGHGHGHGEGHGVDGHHCCGKGKGGCHHDND